MTASSPTGDTTARAQETEARDVLAGKLLDHLIDVEPAMPDGGVAPDGAMAVRLANLVIKAGWRPSGDTGQAPDVAAQSDREIARAFHEAYERLAPEYGYETRPETAAPWDQVSFENRSLMIATVREVRALLGTDTTQEAGSG